jgi:exodeoxyribonuclease-3
MGKKVKIEYPLKWINQNMSFTTGDTLLKSQSMTTFCIFNCRSLRSIWRKNGLPKILKPNYDIIIWTEIQATVPQLYKVPNLASHLYPHCSWNTPKKGHCGVSIWSRIRPQQILLGMPKNLTGHLNEEGRVITNIYCDIILVGVYKPTGTGDRQNIRIAFDIAFKTFLLQLQTEYPSRRLIVGGDFNVAPTDKDTSEIIPWSGPNPPTKPPCSHPWQRLPHEELLMELDLYDAAVKVNSHQKTWFPEPTIKNERLDIGIRLDFLLISLALVSHVIYDYQVLGHTQSDHRPVIVTLKPKHFTNALDISQKHALLYVQPPLNDNLKDIEAQLCQDFLQLAIEHTVGPPSTPLNLQSQMKILFCHGDMVEMYKTLKNYTYRNGSVIPNSVDTLSIAMAELKGSGSAEVFMCFTISNKETVELKENLLDTFILKDNVIMGLRQPIGDTDACFREEWGFTEKFLKGKSVDRLPKAYRIENREKLTKRVTIPGNQGARYATSSEIEAIHAQCPERTEIMNTRLANILKEFRGYGSTPHVHLRFGRRNWSIMIDTGSTYNLMSLEAAKRYIPDFDKKFIKKDMMPLTLGDGQTHDDMTPMGHITNVPIFFRNVENAEIECKAKFIILPTLSKEIIIGYQFFKDHGNEKADISLSKHELYFRGETIPLYRPTLDTPAFSCAVNSSINTEELNEVSRRDRLSCSMVLENMNFNIQDCEKKYGIGCKQVLNQSLQFDLFDHPTSLLPYKVRSKAGLGYTGYHKRRNIMDMLDIETPPLRKSFIPARNGPFKSKVEKNEAISTDKDYVTTARDIQNKVYQLHSPEHPIELPAKSTSRITTYAPKLPKEQYGTWGIIESFNKKRMEYTPFKTQFEHLSGNSIDIWVTNFTDQQYTLPPKTSLAKLTPGDENLYGFAGETTFKATFNQAEPTATSQGARGTSTSHNGADATTPDATMPDATTQKEKSETPTHFTEKGELDPKKIAKIPGGSAI